MTETERLLRRQAEWQKTRQAAPWPEKIRLVERMRPSIEAIRGERKRHLNPGIPQLANSGRSTPV